MKLVGIMALLLPLVNLGTSATAAETDFTQRYVANQRGGIVRAANSVVTCEVGLTATAPTCDAARGGANVSNNSYAFTFIDIDGDASTFDSSSATLKIPAGSEVTNAQLYWGANLRTTRDTPGLPAGNRNAPDAGKKNEVKFMVPGSGAYVTVAADDVYEMPIGTDPTYQARADVTAQVKAAGAGEYMLADVQAARGSSNLGAFGGWTLVVAYKNTGEDFRNLTIYDGFRLMERFKPPITIDLSGFVTPSTGTVNARLGVVAYDGDKSGTGDRMSIKTDKGTETAVADGLNPASNVFNSTITTLGAQESDREPGYVNTLGYDSDVFDVSSAFRNGDSSLRLTMGTNNENYAPGVVFMQIDLYESHATIAKKVAVVGGGDAETGSILEYTMTVTSDGDDPATQVTVTDQIPTFTTYEPGTLKIAGAAQTDAAGDDEADFASGSTTFRLGTGADATTGGELAKGKSVTFSFRVRVDASAQGQMVENTAKLSYVPKTLSSATLTDEASTTTPVREFADLEVKKAGPATARPGATVIYTITVTNKGPDTSKSVTLTDTLTQVMPSATKSATAGCTTTADGLTCDLGDLASGASKTIELVVTVPADAEAGGIMKDEAKVSSSTLDPNPDNDVTQAETTVDFASDVTIKKTGPKEVKAGGPIMFVITASNAGPDPADPSRIIDVVSSLVQKVTWTCSGSGGATCYTPSGSGNEINALAKLPKGGTVVVRINGTVAASATGKSISNVARIVLPSGQTDPVVTPPVKVVTKVTPKPTPTPTEIKVPKDACRNCAFVGREHARKPAA